MTTPVLISSLLLTSMLLATPFARADSASPTRAADPASKRTPPAGVATSTASSGTTNGTTNGTLRTSKTSLGLRIDYAFDTPATGSTTEVRLKVEGNEAGRPLSIEVVPGTGLQMARGLPGNIAMQSVPSDRKSVV